MNWKRMKRAWMLCACAMFLGLSMGTCKVQAKGVDDYGALKVSGTHLVSRRTNENVVLRGVSTHGINWDVGYPYISKKAFQTLRDDYSVNAVRLAMYTTEYYGYCDKGSASESQSQVQKTLQARIDTGVKAATDLGMYVIIDWHILNDQNPNKYKKQAKAFFKDMSEKYAQQDNVLYEICNEPNGGTSWSDITKYAKEIIPVIRKNDPDAIIIVGTPTWSQDVDQAAADPIKGDNIMYALHFYAATHKTDLRNKMTAAINKGLPVFVTEYGICDASGNGAIDKKEADRWIQTMDEYGVSYIAWNLSNKQESSSIIKSSCPKVSGFKKSELSDEGRWLYHLLRKKAGLTK